MSSEGTSVVGLSTTGDVSTSAIEVATVSSEGTSVVGVSKIGDVSTSTIASMSTTAIVCGTVIVVCVIVSPTASNSTMTIVSCTVSGSVSVGVGANTIEVEVVIELARTVTIVSMIANAIEDRNALEADYARLNVPNMSRLTSGCLR